MSAKLTLAVGPSDHAQGRADAPVTLLEYGDYECSHCGRAYPIVKAVQHHLGAGLRFVFRNFPLREQHPHAEAAAEAAEAAAAQGKFWEMHDALFEHQSALSRPQLMHYAQQLELDLGRFARELDARVYAQRVRDDLTSGELSDVQGTPTFFINGLRHDGPFDERTLMSVLEHALREHHH